MSEKRCNVKSKKSGGKESKESVKLDSLQTSLSSLFLRNSKRPRVSKVERKKSVKRSTRTSLPVGIDKSKQSFPRLDIPEDVAVHFGNFYCLENNKSKNNGSGARHGGTTNTEFPARHSPRSEFTRQMVHELERLAGTEDYARQISALLEETVESPNYAVQPPPDDTFFSYKRSDLTNYPLWYKDPDRTKFPGEEASSSIDMAGKHVSESKMHACKSATASEGRKLMSERDSRRTFVIEDLDEYDSSSMCSKTSVYSSDETDEESDSEECKIRITVK